jgi:hypothetical protein
MLLPPSRIYMDIAGHSSLKDHYVLVQSNIREDDFKTSVIRFDYQSDDSITDTISLSSVSYVDPQRPRFVYSERRSEINLKGSYGYIKRIR